MARPTIYESLEPRRLLSLAVPALSSLPAATKQIYLDFDGSDPFAWTDGSQNYAIHGAGDETTPVPVFDADGDPSDFSDAELAEVQTIWAGVAEKFSPFNVNVTTVDPGNRADNVTAAILIGGSRFDWLNQDVDGFSALSGFVSPTRDNTAFVFAADQQALSGSARDHLIVERAARELGREFGLVNQLGSNAAPYAGDGIEAPIMGDSTHTDARGIWWRTNAYPGQNYFGAIRDELVELTSPGAAFAYRTDDNPSIQDWRPLNVNGDGTIVPTNGVIERVGDTDSFSFSNASAFSFRLSNVSANGMLSPDVRVFDLTQGAYISFQSTRIDSFISFSAGGLIRIHEYRVDVFGRQNYNGATAAYGNIGQYSLTGALEIPYYFNPTSAVAYVNGYFQPNNIRLSLIYSSNGSTSMEVRFFNTAGVQIGGASENVLRVGSIAIDPSQGYDDRITVEIGRGSTNNGNVVPPIYVNGGGGADTFSIEGSGFAGPSPFVIHDASHISWLKEDSSFASIERVEIHQNVTVDTEYDLHGWEATTPLYIYGTNAVDELFVYSPAIESGSGFVSFDGAGGTLDNIIFDSGLNEDGHAFDGSGSNVTIDNNRLQIGFLHTESLYFNGGQGDDTFKVFSDPSSLRLTFYGNDGDDALIVGDDLSELTLHESLGSIYFTGGEGSDSIELDDRQAATQRIYFINAGVFSSNAGVGTVNFDSAEAFTLDGGINVKNTFNVAGANENMLFSLIGGELLDGFNLQPQGGTSVFQFDGNGSRDNVYLHTGFAQFIEDQDLNLLTIDSGGIVTAAATERLLDVNAISISADARFDLADGDLIARATPLTTVESYIRAAYNFGDWLGAGGIFSSTARDNPLANTTLGLLSGQEFNDNNGGAFNGLSVSNSDVLVKYTYFGDVDFNGSIDASDYNLVDFGYTNHLTGWGWGDADYSGGPTDVSDYNLIDFAFATQSGAL